MRYTSLCLYMNYDILCWIEIPETLFKTNPNGPWFIGWIARSTIWYLIAKSTIQFDNTSVCVHIFHHCFMDPPWLDLHSSLPIPASQAILSKALWRMGICPRNRASHHFPSSFVFAWVMHQNLMLTHDFPLNGGHLGKISTLVWFQGKFSPETIHFPMKIMKIMGLPCKYFPGKTNPFIIPHFFTPRVEFHGFSYVRLEKPFCHPQSCLWHRHLGRNTLLASVHIDVANCFFPIIYRSFNMFQPSEIGDAGFCWPIWQYVYIHIVIYYLWYFMILLYTCHLYMRGHMNKQTRNNAWDLDWAIIRLVLVRLDPYTSIQCNEYIP